MKIAMAQINTIVGDFTHTLEKILDRLAQARCAGADLVVFPELTLTGYPPKDLLEMHGFVEKNLETLGRLEPEVTGIAAVVGFISPNRDRTGKPLFNSAALIADGRVQHVINKCLLPMYDVFDEARYFEPKSQAGDLVDFQGTRLALNICEDFWNDQDLFAEHRYGFDPVKDQAARGAGVFINISASPFSLGKPELRQRLAAHAAAKYGVPVVMVNQVGGYDDIVFDGSSLAVNARGQLIARANPFREELVMADLSAAAAIPTERTDEAEQIYQALVLGTRDYTRKCGFSQVVIGLSGGIDSALVACVAAEALGAENVLGVAMPSPFNSPSSLTDARALCQNLGIRLETIPINNIYQVFLDQLQPVFGGKPFDATEENLQARIRGTLLMAISNKSGAMVLSTGNKSELAVGYSTLYGDMCGGLAVISDLLKTRVYQVSRWINRSREIIPRSTMEKAPSAELRPGQTDQDDLPPYDQLDAILALYIEEQLSMKEIVDRGFEPGLVRRTLRMVDRNEYKRRQAPPGLKVTDKAFGVGRRLPIVQHFTD